MSGEGMSTDRATFFDGIGFPRWKVLMQAHLQARGLDVWRVTELGKRDNMMPLLSQFYCPLYVIVCLIVFLLMKMLISNGSKLSRIMRAQRMWPIKNTIFSARS